MDLSLVKETLELQLAGKIKISIVGRTTVFSWENKEIPAAELWAIAEALEIARKETLNNHNTPITILSDPREALTVSSSQPLTQKVQEP